MRNKKLHYLVEGEDEEKLVNTLKKELRLIEPGRVKLLNVVEEEIPDAFLRTVALGTVFVLVFDTDTGQREILDRNIKKLKSKKYGVITIPQVSNLEEELERCCNIKNITELLNSRSERDFKRDIKRVTNLASKLREHQFNINRFWIGKPTPPYQDIENQGAKVKLSK